MHRWLEDILNLAFPHTCHICGAKLAPHERFACTHCLDSLPRTGYHRREMNPMEERFAGKFPFRNATGHFFYTRDSALSTLIQDMKYRHFPGIGEMLGNLVAQELFISGFFNEIDLLLPIPIHFLKKARRGYNQTRHIASGINRATGIPISDSLVATRSHRTQTSLTHRQRMENTSGIFAIRHRHEISGKNVLIIDDVCTTGSTITSAAATIHHTVPSANISILTLGVTF